MPRYILIDNASGYIFGDTADLEGGLDVTTPIEAAEALDRSIREYGRQYEFSPSHRADTADGYHVYRADIRGSEAIPVVQDGQDQSMIAAVLRDCEYVGFVATSREG